MKRLVNLILFIIGYATIVPIGMFLHAISHHIGNLTNSESNDFTNRWIQDHVPGGIWILERRYNIFLLFSEIDRTSDKA